LLDTITRVNPHLHDEVGIKVKNGIKVSRRLAILQIALIF